MPCTTVHIRRAGSARVSTLVLVGIATGFVWWGAALHWTVPRFATQAVAGEPVAAVALRPTAPVKAPSADAAELPAALAAPVPPEPFRFHFNSPASVAKVGLKTTAVERRSMDQFVTANGVVDYHPSRIAQLASRVAGFVWRVEKQVGETVVEGDVLALIDASEVGKAKAELLQAVRVAELKEKHVERLKSIAASIAERQIREAETELAEARIRLFYSQQTLLNLGLPVRIEDLSGVADEERERRIRFLGLPASVTETMPETKTANLIPLTAPFAGVVIGHSVVRGEVVSPSHPEFTIADVSRLWIKLDVRLEDSVRLDLSQELIFSPDGIPGEVHGTITWISTEVDEKTRTVRIGAAVDNPLQPGASGGPGQRLLRAHTYGTGRIRIRSQPAAVVVPRDAVQWDGHHHLVFRREDELTYEAKTVRLGVLTDDYAEILDGIQPAEAVVTVGSHVLKSEIIKRRQTGEQPR